jgi:hypothetical protein
MRGDPALNSIHLKKSQYKKERKKQNVGQVFIFKIGTLFIEFSISANRKNAGQLFSVKPLLLLELFRPG